MINIDLWSLKAPTMENMYHADCISIQARRTTLRKKNGTEQYPLRINLENGTTFAKWHSFFLNNHVYPFCNE